MALLDAMIKFSQARWAMRVSDAGQFDGRAIAARVHQASYAEGRRAAGLLSGHHATIARWRSKQRLGVTWLKRPDLLDRLELIRNSRHYWTNLNESTGQTERDGTSFRSGVEQDEQGHRKDRNRADGEELPEFGPGGLW